MSVGSRHRRRLMEMGNKDQWKDWIKLYIRNSGSNNLICNIKLTTISKMMIDGEEVTPVNYYTFGDTDYHDVRILINGTKLYGAVNSIWQNYTVRYADYPAKITEYEAGLLRNLGASQRVDTAIRAEQYPTFGTYNFYGWTLGHLYVPASLYDDYIAAAPIPTARIHLLSEYPYTFS